MQNQALLPCFVSSMLSSVTTELAVAAFGSLGCRLGLLQVVLASLLVFCLRQIWLGSTSL